ncbi:hemin import ATP-binding protein HmuV [Flavobacteriaceae bacterium UJ101]|nr:hemin import ATP-binding protein HmuV [Flavobacteriaceae bacterium UJ101]
MRAITVKNLSIGYDKTILKNINFSIEEGEVVSLIGKNGVGKSTLIKTILGLIPSKGGVIKIGGENIKKYNSVELAREVSVVLTNQEVNPILSVVEVLGLGRTPYKNIFSRLNVKDWEKINQTIQLLEIEDLKEKRIGELSDGQKQRVMIGRALVQDTGLIILDEPTTHLDLSGKFTIFQLLRRLAQITNKTILLSTHQIDLALPHSDKILFIKGNQLIEDTPEEIGWKHQIFQYFSNEQMRFDYTLGKFTSVRRGIRHVQLEGEGALLYWVRHALYRNAIDIKENAPILVKVLGDVISVHVNGVIEYVDNFENLINYIKLIQVEGSYS